MNDEHLCLLPLPERLYICLVTASFLRSLCQLNIKRSCYGINLVLTGKAEKSKQGCLGPGNGGAEAGRAQGWRWGLLPLQPCSYSVQGSGSGSGSPSMHALGVGRLQDLCGGVLLFCGSSLCWLLAFAGLLEAGAGHSCHNPSTESGGCSLRQWQ